MKWIKISEKLPDFDKTILLLEKKDDRYICNVGSLKSIDGNGTNWSTNTFLGIFPSQSNFKPTYWCEIELPREG